MPRESMTNILQCDMHVHCFICHSWNCAPQTHSTDTNICVDFYKMCGKNNLRSGIMETGSIIITLFQHTLCLCRNFWTIMARLLTCTLWTLDVAPSEFFLFPKLNWCWGTEISLNQHIQELQATFSEFWTQDVLNFFQKLHNHSASWIHFQGDCFKRDRMA